jgi:hypothetical protein
MQLNTSIIRQMSLDRQQEAHAAAARARLAREARHTRHFAPEPARRAARECCPKAVPA